LARPLARHRPPVGVRMTQRVEPRRAAPRRGLVHKRGEYAIAESAQGRPAREAGRKQPTQPGKRGQIGHNKEEQKFTTNQNQSLSD